MPPVRSTWLKSSSSFFEVKKRTGDWRKKTGWNLCQLFRPCPLSSICIFGSLTNAYLLASDSWMEWFQEMLSLVAAQFREDGRGGGLQIIVYKVILNNYNWYNHQFWTKVKKIRNFIILEWLHKEGASVLGVNIFGRTKERCP